MSQINILLAKTDIPAAIRKQIGPRSKDHCGIVRQLPIEGDKRLSWGFSALQSQPRGMPRNTSLPGRN